MTTRCGSCRGAGFRDMAPAIDALEISVVERRFDGNPADDVLRQRHPGFRPGGESKAGQEQVAPSH